MSYIPQTYTFSAATSNEAHSVTDITTVLSLLPDNTSKEITPRDVRDAIASTWESSVIRYTSDGSTSYIGVDRGDVKDIKLLLGKKQLSSSNVMSSMLLNSSDSDIFVYNFKSDSAVTQDTKMTFLAGTPSSNLFASGPYIKATYVTSPSMISLNLINPATFGTINIISGFSASISLNNLSWPSPSYISDVLASPTTASASNSTTLFLAVRAGSTLELVKYTAGGGTLGSPGSATTIFGSPVTVNGFNLEYSNNSPTIATFGGIPIGSTFSNVPLIQMIESMLYPELPPSAIVVINTVLNPNSTLERRHTGSPAITINYSIILTRKTNNITSNTISLIRHTTAFSPSGGWPTLTLSGSGLVTQTFGPYTVGINGSQISSYTDRSVFTFSSRPSDGTLSSTYSTNFEVVWPYFYGFSVTASGLAANIQANALGTDYSAGKIVKRVDTQTDQELFFNGTGYQHFMYPSLYGTVSSILDGNNYTEYTHNSTSVWTYSLATLDSPQGSSYWLARQYYVYRKTIESTSPTQLYKFNF